MSLLNPDTFVPVVLRVTIEPAIIKEFVALSSTTLPPLPLLIPAAISEPLTNEVGEVSAIPPADVVPELVMLPTVKLSVLPDTVRLTDPPVPVLVPPLVTFPTFKDPPEAEAVTFPPECEPADVVMIEP